MTEPIEFVRHADRIPVEDFLLRGTRNVSRWNGRDAECWSCSNVSWDEADRLLRIQFTPVEPMPAFFDPSTGEIVHPNWHELVEYNEMYFGEQVYAPAFWPISRTTTVLLDRSGKLLTR